MALQKVRQAQLLQPRFDVLFWAVDTQQQVLAQACFKQHSVLRGIGDQLMHLPCSGQSVQVPCLSMACHVPVTLLFAEQPTDPIDQVCLAAAGGPCDRNQCVGFQ